MQILFHLGAHCTDNGLLIRSILRNRANLVADGTVVPGPGRYRELLGAVSTTLRGDYASEDTEDMLLEEICDNDTARRLVLSNENFLCRPQVAIGADGLYPKAEKSAWLRRCFPSHDVRFAIATRSPATFIPTLLASLSDEDRDRAEHDLALDQLSWADVIAEIIEANPRSQVTAWAHEDAAFVWPDIMYDLTGFDLRADLDGTFDMVESLLSTDGVERLRAFLADHPVLSEEHLRKTLLAFLTSHEKTPAAPPAELPEGWSDETTAALDLAYREDIARIAKLPQVTWLDP